MALFKYECLNSQGDVIKGQIEAENSVAAASMLKSMNLMVSTLKETHIARKSSFLSNDKKVTIGDLSIFCKQLAAMINAGIPITTSLFTLSEQSKNNTFRNVLETIGRSVEGGMNLTDAFSAHPKIFPKLFISMIHAGEVGGNLDTSLIMLSEQLRKDKELQDNIKAATFYPRLVLGFAVLLMIAMLLFLVPIFQSFIPADAQVPGITSFVFNVSVSLRNRWYIWAMVVAVLIAGFMVFTKTSRSQLIWENIKFKLPAFGQLLHKSVIARFCRTLSTLIEGGIPIVQALESAGPTSGSLLVSRAVTEASNKVAEGRGISGPLNDSGLFPPMVIQMIAVGEESGALSSLLEKVAQFYEDDVSSISKKLTSLIEPIMLVVVGLLVGGMLITLYLPIFTVISGVN